MAIIVKRGDSGQAVRRLQRKLRRVGRHVALDGEFGPATDREVRRFQRARGLEVDGVVGPETWAELGARVRFFRLRKRRTGKGPHYGHNHRARRQARTAVQRRRAAAVAFAARYVGTTESPAGSNQGGPITAWQRALGAWLVGTAWCGTFCAACLRAAGVQGVTWRLASVAFIEDDARGKVAPFGAWQSDPRKAEPGDLVVLFGRGVHVELVVAVRSTYLETVGGNTSSGSWGSQSNGGGVYRRVRPFRDVHGVARVDYKRRKA